jgi:RimJ/RimL family protein N-acetyltransferase
VADLITIRHDAQMDPQRARQPTMRLIDPKPDGWLRPLAERDISALTATCQDPESAEWTTVPVPYRTEDAVQFVRAIAPQMWSEGRGAIFAISAADDAYCGTIDLRILATDPSAAEVGFMISPESRGQGFAPSALKTLSVWGFKALGLQRIMWRAHVGNDSSRRVAVKAGFVYEGIQRSGVPHRGERRDAWVASLLPSDLPAALQQASFEIRTEA